MRRHAGVFAVATLALLAFVTLSVLAQAPRPGELVKQADKLFEEKHYKEAADAYEKALAAGPTPKQLEHGFDRLIACRLRLSLFDEALEAAETYVTRTAHTPQEARAERLAGNLYLNIPHWGTRAGGKFHRAQWIQGIQVRSWRYDKEHALRHLERARELYRHYEEGLADGKRLIPKARREAWHNERIECIFELAGGAARFTIYENEWYYWYSWWGERDEFLAQTAGEEDFDEYHSDWQLRRKRPIGLRLDADGKPIFPTKPGEYSPDLGDEQKILYLLDEARGLDRTKEGRYTALSYYRQAMLARARFGMDRLNGYAGLYYSGGRRPLQEELEDYNPWELKDDEALVLAGGRITRVELPDEFNVLKLLRVVAGDYPGSGYAPQSRYAAGLYYQTRQQYVEALAQYDKLKNAFPKDPWAGSANSQIHRILAAQVRISQMGVQLPGLPAEVQVSYRNTGKVWFVAREIDVKGFLEELRANVIDRDRKRSYIWSLRSWHNYFMDPGNQRDRDHWIHQAAAKHVGREIKRWTAEVEDDGSHRYAHVTLQAPITRRGAYMVYAYLKEPPAQDAQKTGTQLLGLGSSRAVMVLTDLAIVEKKVEPGNLYYVADARSGAPVAGAEVSVLEVWSTHDRKLKRHFQHKKLTDLKADRQGMVVFERPTDHPRGSLHLLVSAGEGRLAWSGMSYWTRYRPSAMRDGLFAYVITDRPVYRPEQKVQFKVWLRHMRDGNLENAPGRSVHITIHDPRGNKVHDYTGRTDQFGGLDGYFTLGEEPTLGVYNLTVRSIRHAGGGTFRVEEYKKPEFEVSVEPAKTHMKLGEKVTALIRADYYFGAPVTDATVSYKVFREEYTHTHYPPGRWDWLYGSGYGYGWYAREWFPWWGRMRSCWAPPGWWWGWYGYPAPTPVRELVMEAEQPIGDDGTVTVEIDTAPALRDHPDRDHRYVIEAEVRDASRRTITGEGAVKVTRQAYYAFIHSDRGYYRPGEEMQITVRCLTPGNKPVETEGVVTVSRVVFGGPDNARIEETELKRWKAKTDGRGLLTFRLRHERSDQLKFKFEAPDQWGGTVEGYGLVWVCGRDFDGKLYRFNDLELITDKRTYEPGEVCHLMINTRQKGSYVLFSDDVDSNHLLSWKLLHLPDRHVVVDVPVKKGHRPNFFVEATTISQARVHQQVRRICVPPEEGVADVAVETDKAQYRPREKATVRVTARTPDGKPAQAQVVLSAFDRSVLYIQPEYTPPIAKFFHGHTRHHGLQMSTNLLEQFSAWGYVERPFQRIHPVPPEWRGIWGPTVDDWRTFSSMELKPTRAPGFAGGMRGAYSDMSVAGSPAEAEGKEMLREEAGAPAPAPAPGEAPAFAEAEVRQEFADTALWLTTLTTDRDGTARAEFDMPDNLTTWKVNAWAMTKQTRVGQSSTEAVTTKNLLVRLQAPRFFMEYDEVVISANVHNYLGEDKTARVSLDVPAELLQLMEGQRATADVNVPAGGEKRVDWRVRVKKEGLAAVKVEALTDEESDAMLMSFPVLVHGMTKQVARTGSMRPAERRATRTVELDVPQERRPELTRLEVQFAPSLVGAMLDALPYCLDYPYGCTEQTVSRFLPAVLTLKTLQNMGVDLEEVRNIRGRMAEIRRIEKGERRRIYADSPVFDSDEMHSIIQKGLSRITNMQHGDGGWGWWTQDSSSAYLTAYILHALVTARECDVNVDQGMIQRGMNFLKRWEEQEMLREYWTPHAQHAFAAYVLSLAKMRAVCKPPKDDKRPADCIERLYEGRDKLNLYGKALLSMAAANLGEETRARTVLRNIMQYKQDNPETEVAWFRTPSAGWWYWWNSDIETNAWILRAIVRLEPDSDVAPRLVKWLLENRRNGYYWRSTRDTTLCVAAMSDFVAASGEGQPDYVLTLDLDGQVVKKVKITKDNFFTFDNRFVVEGVALTSGRHTLKISKEGPGALYYSSYLRYFTKERDIKAAGLQLKVARRYFKLVRIPYEVEVEGAEGQKIIEKRLRYERVPINSGDRVESGELIQVELDVKSDNTYTYLCFEDMKPAGCEAVEVRSGGQRQEGFHSYMELRDEKVVFFVSELGQGSHLLRYRLRAEIPGVFHALPSVLYGMYVPELRANSDELVLGIDDK